MMFIMMLLIVSFFVFFCSGFGGFIDFGFLELMDLFLVYIYKDGYQNSKDWDDDYVNFY